MVQRPYVGCSQSKKKLHTRVIRNKRKGIYIIKTFLLCKTLSHQMIFWPLNCTISIILNGINPLATNHILSRRKTLNITSSILLKTLNFALTEPRHISTSDYLSNKSTYIYVWVTTISKITKAEIIRIDNIPWIACGFSVSPLSPIS